MTPVATDPETGFLTSVTDQGGNQFSVITDPDGRVIHFNDPDGTVSFDYAPSAITMTDEKGHATTKSYDGLGRLTGVDGPYNSESFSYNWLDEVTTDSVPSGSTYYHYYDAIGRPTGTSNPGGTSNSLRYFETTKGAYAVMATDENRNSINYTYNYRQLLTAVSTYGAAYTYDRFSRLKSTTMNGQVTSYSYDNVGDLLQTTFPSGKTATATYDTDGNMISRVSPNGTHTSYNYNGLNQLTGITCVSGCGAGTLSIGYDGYGHLNHMSGTGFASLDRVYNWRGEITDEWLGPLYTAFNYDAAGNLQTVNYPDGTSVGMDYDAQNRLTSVGSYATSFTYSPGNDLFQVTFGNGASQTFSFDPRDRLSGANGVDYGLDNVGNVGVLGYNGVTYNYDHLNRLTGTSGGWLGSTSYTYDDAGNLKTMTENGKKTTLNYKNNLASPYSSLINTTIGTTLKSTYGYDGDGNMISRNGSSWKLVYNYLDQMTTAVHSGQSVETNSFDGSGRRSSRTVGSVTTYYAYMGDRVLYEENDSGSQVTGKILHVYGDGIQLAEIVNGGTRYPVQDPVGSTVQVNDASGGTAYQANYHPWGKADFVTSGPESLKFTSMPYDSTIGLYFFGTRFYDPTVGRFVQQDSLRGDISRPLSLNMYVYAGNSPETFSDITGHDWDPRTWTSTQWILFGSAVILTVAAVVELGLNPAADAVAGMDDAALVGSLSATAPIGIGDGVVADMAPESGAVASAIDQGIVAGGDRVAASMLDNLGEMPKSPGVGAWGEDFFQHFLKPLGFVRGFRIATPIGDLCPDFYNPITRMAVDIKLGAQDLSAVIETQMTKYALAEMQGSISRVAYFLFDNPWNGAFTTGLDFFEAMNDYGIHFAQLG